MYRHRTYVEQSDDFEQMIQLITQLNALHLCDWSVGRMYAWKYGRWSKRSQDDAQFETQAELFFDPFDHLCGILITEDFGGDYYLLSEKKEDILQNMILYLEDKLTHAAVSIILSHDDIILQNALADHEFTYECDADITYFYHKSNIVLPNIALPHGFLLSDQKGYTDADAVEQQRFFSFHPTSDFDEVIDQAYRYARNNPLLVPELNIVLLDEAQRPISSCMGYWDKYNQLMEIEVVATKPGYENKGLAKIVISKCVRRGLDLGVVELSISAWEEKTRKLYSSFGDSVVLKKVKYKRSSLTITSGV